MIAAIVLSNRQNQLPVPAWVFPVFFVGMWLMITFLVSLTSGWRKLAEVYRADQPFFGTRLSWQSASFRGTSYNNSLVLGVSNQGLHIVPMLLFRAFHPALFIPWSEIVATPVTMWKMVNLVEIRFQRVPDIPVRIRATVAAQLSEASLGQFRVAAAATARMS